jgi:hypothetical protein
LVEFNATEIIQSLKNKKSDTRVWSSVKKWAMFEVMSALMTLLVSELHGYVAYIWMKIASEDYEGETPQADRTD